jgi:pimeloyl-ACP methyl ester carboxylesterase
MVPGDRFVRTQAVDLHCLDWGTVGHPRVLLLPGVLQTAHTFDEVCVALRSEYHCVAADPRGHGDSSWSPELDYGIEAQTVDVAAVVEQLGWSDVVLVGNSMGGRTALHYTAVHPERVAAVILLDVGPELQLAGVRRRTTNRGRAAQEIESIDAYVANALARNPNLDEGRLRQSLRHNLRATEHGTWIWKWDPRFPWQLDPIEYAQTLEILWRDVDTIQQPVLVLRGERSDVFHDSDAEHLAGRFARGAWLRIPNAGHAVQSDNPASVAAAISEFLDAVLATPRAR